MPSGFPRLSGKALPRRRAAPQRGPPLTALGPTQCEDLTVVQHSFAARSYRDDAVVLRTHKLGEADRIITLLTKHHGQIRAVAKGVRRTSSQFGARLEPFMVADLQFVSGKTWTLSPRPSPKAPTGAGSPRITGGTQLLRP